jgi:predicted alpha-1,2-mannosidase
MRRGALVAVGLTLGLAPGARADLAASVDPFVGTAPRGDPSIRHGGGAGATVPGAAVPFGLVQLSPETWPARAAFGAGYAYADRHLRGFSPTHVSGAGCAVFGDVPLLPLARAVTRPPAGATLPRFTHAGEHASPGRYAVTAAGVRTEVTATARTGRLRIRFPRGRPATLLVDAGGSQDADDTATVRIDPRRRAVAATATGGRFCGRANRYRVSVVVRLDRTPIAWGTWQAGRAIRRGATRAAERRAATGARTVPGAPPQPPPRGARAGAMLRFAPGSTVEARIGVSFVDLAGARRNLAAEAPAARSFATTARAARAAWNRALARVRVGGGTRAGRTTFASALYHALLHPNMVGDADGRYPGLDGRVHRARGWAPRTTIAGWDIYRTQFPLLALAYDEQARDVVRSLVAGAAQSPGGCLPRWTVAGADTRVMVGEPTAILIAEAHAFGVPGVDWPRALDAALRTVGPACRAADDRAADPGRDGSASVALERATADFAVARMARALHRDAEAAPLEARAGAWRDLAVWDADPASTAGLVESTAAQYAWAVPQDVAGLAAAMGGREAALARLDATDTVGALGNEPGFLLPWISAMLGRPAATDDAVRRALTTSFSPTPGGLPGNDDTGALSAWFVLAALGRYPAVPGTAVFVRTRPLFARARVHTRDGVLALG